MAIDHSASNVYTSARFAPRPAPVGRMMSAKQRATVERIVIQLDATALRMIRATTPQGSVTQAMLDEVAAEYTPAHTVRKIQEQLNRTDVTHRYGDPANLISILLAQLKAIEASAAAKEARATLPARTPVEDGKTYRSPSDSRVFHAYLGQSGQLLAKVWTPTGEISPEGKELGAFEYYGHSSKLPRDITELSLQEAQEFGRATGTCCMCMRHLTNDESVAAGIGPICRDKF